MEDLGFLPQSRYEKFKNHLKKNAEIYVLGGFAIVVGGIVYLISNMERYPYSQEDKAGYKQLGIHVRRNGENAKDDFTIRQFRLAPDGVVEVRDIAYGPAEEKSSERR